MNTCGRCGRGIRTEASVRAGYGPKCLARIRQAEATANLNDFKPVQVEAAREIIEDHAIVWLRNCVFIVVSDSGDSLYRVSSSGICNCPHGIRSLTQAHCKHVAAARIWAAAA